MENCQETKSGQGCRKAVLSPDAKPNGLAEIIESYKGDGYRFEKIKEDMKSIGDCVFGDYNDVYTEQGLRRPSRRNVHQRHLKTKDILAFVHKIEALLPQSQAKDFDALWQEVKGTECKGVGPVTRYDVALRYSLWKELPEPEYVYLHSGNGPLKGAKEYFKYKKVTNVVTPEGIRSVNRLNAGCRIDKSNFPELVQSELDAKHIERFLCVMADELEKLNGSSAKS